MFDFSNFPPIYNNIKDFNTIPILNIENVNNGTDYIDYIKVENMKYPLMQGKDNKGRLFFCIKTELTNLNNKSETVVGTFYQRFSEDETIWSYSSYYHDNIIYYQSRVNKNDYNNLEQRLKLLFDKTTINDYEETENKKPLDFIIGNGCYKIKLTD